MPKARHPKLQDHSFTAEDGLVTLRAEGAVAAVTGLEMALLRAFLRVFWLTVRAGGRKGWFRERKLWGVFPPPVRGFVAGGRAGCVRPGAASGHD